MSHQAVGFHSLDWLTYEPLREESLREPLIENNNRMFHQGIGIHFLDTERLIYKPLRELRRQMMLKYFQDGIDMVHDELRQSLQCESSKSKIFHFSQDELDFLPENVVDVFRKKGDEYKISEDDFNRILRQNKDPEVRKCVSLACRQRRDNTKLLEQLCYWRHKYAVLRGFNNHASSIQKYCTAKNPSNVMSFYSELIPKFQNLWNKEKTEILKLKLKDCTDNGESFNGQLKYWDVEYYTEKILVNHFNVDREILREYFPVNKVVEGLFEIFEQIFCLQISRCKKSKMKGFVNLRSLIRHQDLYEIYDLESKDVLGYFYLDLFRRKGKRPGGGSKLLQLRCKGMEALPVYVVRTNFSPPTSLATSLLYHDDVVTLFRKFGYVMQYTCSQCEDWDLLCTPNDLVDLNGKLFENWAWDEECLRKISGHHENNEPMPENLLRGLLASRNAMMGYSNLYRITYGLLDQQMHTRQSCDATQYISDTFKELTGIDMIQSPAKVQFCINQMLWISARFYGSLWSSAYATDVYKTTFENAGLRNPVAGTAYKRTVLKSIRLNDTYSLLAEYLGRPPTQTAFMNSLDNAKTI